MIEYREIPESDMLELVIDGSLTAAEYHTVAQQALAFIETHKKVRVLKEIRSFTGFDIAIFKEKLVGAMVKHINDIRATAVVSDEHWVEQLTNFLKPLYPYPVQCFRLEQLEEARRWLKSV